MKIMPSELTLEQLRQIWQQHTAVSLDDSAYQAIDASHAALQQIIGRDKSAYGINTGFGLLARTRISDDQLEQLQKNLILSHSVGTGEALSDGLVRLILVLKAASLARGYSGVRREIVDGLLALYNHEIMPIIPSRGSVGASGDLAPLSHMTLALIGEGEVRVRGVLKPAAVALKEAGLQPIDLAAKEGLALINGTQVSTALALQGLFLTENIHRAATVVGALSVDAFKGSDTPFDPRIHAVRGQAGQIKQAKQYLTLLQGSGILASHQENPVRVQDPYCLRCQPQVMGAALDLIEQAAKTLLVEANAVTDNPLIFHDGSEPVALSGGNFHAEPVAFAADTLALALTEIGNMSERRVAMLIDSTLSGLPAFLVKNAGVNSGFMIAHVTAAALASENKSHAHPASADTIPTSANQEDHVSMATYAARRLTDMAQNTATVVGIEYLAACQGIDFHAPLQTSAPLQKAHQRLRQQVAHYAEDRLFAPDIAAAKALVIDGELAAYL